LPDSKKQKEFIDYLELFENGWYTGFENKTWFYYIKLTLDREIDKIS